MDATTSPAPVETAPPAEASPALTLPPEAKPVEPAKETPKSDAKVEAPAGVKLPDGFKLEPGEVEFFQKELGPKAQAAVDKMAALEKARIAAEDTAIAAQDAKWLSEAKADKEIGGAAYDANVKLAQRALAKFGGAEVAQVIHQAGLGNHPGLLRAFVRIGKAMAEDAIGNTATPADKGIPSAEQRLKAAYPTMFPKQE